VIYLDACALMKFIRSEKESTAIRSWREALGPETQLITSDLARLEIARTLRRANVDHTRVPFYVGEALRGVHVMDLTTTVLDRAAAYRVPKLGSLDAIHLASAEPLRADLTDLVTYDQELARAAQDLDLPVTSPN
jgi:predicted nucleic acid-binding protein